MFVLSGRLGFRGGNPMTFDTTGLDGCCLVAVTHLKLVKCLVYISVLFPGMGLPANVKFSRVPHWTRWLC